MSLSDTAPAPAPNPGEVLVKVISSGINPSDLGIVAGHYDDILQATAKNRAKTGFEFSGIVITEGVTFTEGDKVYGYIDFMNGGDWAHQEYISISETAISLMPTTISFDEAATVPLAAQTVLSALSSVADVKSDERMLVIGASGGLGVYALQIGVILNLKISAIAGSDKEDELKAQGADLVYDYNETTLMDIDEKFDIIFDLSTQYRYRDISHLLSQNGRFLPADPALNTQDFEPGTESAEKTKELFVAVGIKDDLEQIANWIDSGKISPVMDSRFALSDFDQAFNRVESKGKRGRVVLRISEDTSF
ncbi:TPA: NAD(P)-dependent alcohol dehydrogenase [Vibrio alginolyticus]